MAKVKFEGGSLDRRPNYGSILDCRPNYAPPFFRDGRVSEIYDSELLRAMLKAVQLWATAEAKGADFQEEAAAAAQLRGIGYETCQ